MPPPPTPPWVSARPSAPRRERRRDGFCALSWCPLSALRSSELLISMWIPSLPFVGHPFVFVAVLILTLRLSDWCKLVSQL